jgi:hypothetical protein
VNKETQTLLLSGLAAYVAGSTLADFQDGLSRLFLGTAGAVAGILLVRKVLS